MSILLGILGAFLLLFLTSTLHYAFCLYRNYLAARKIGVPIRIILIDHVNPLWLVVDRRVLSALKQLPGWLGNNSFTRYNYRGWEVPDRYFSHRELGDAYVLVSSRNVWLYLSDPDAVTDIARRSKEFDRETSVTGLNTPCPLVIKASEILRVRQQYLMFSARTYPLAMVLSGRSTAESLPLLSTTRTTWLFGPRA